MKRIEWIDICKAIAIFCMVFLHIGLEIPYHCQWLDTVIHYWHMPIFIVLSGVVLNTDKYCGWANFGTFVKSRVKTLLIPLLCFGIICLIFNAMFLFPDGAPAKRGTLVQHILYPNTYLHMFEFQWFLVCLFLSEFIYVLLHNLTGGRKWLIGTLSLVLLAGGHLLLQTTGKLPFTLDSTIYALPMFTLGVLGKKMFIDWRPFQKWWAQLLGLAVMLALVLLVKGKFNVRGCTYDPLWIYPFGIFITVTVIMLLKEQEWWITKLRCYDGIKWLGSNTLAILVLNGSVRKIIPWRNLVVSDNIFLVFGVQLLAALVTIVIIYFIVKLVMRYCPWMLGKAKK